MRGLFPSCLLIGLVLIVVIPAFSLAGEKVHFEENFNARLNKGWAWIREDPKGWKIDKGGLHIRVLADVAIWERMNNGKNILVRPLPKRKNQSTTIEVLLHNQPTFRYEHAALLWYLDDDNYVVVAKEHFDGKQQVVFTREVKGKGQVIAKKPYQPNEVWFRLVVSEGKIAAKYRPKDKGRWQNLGQCDLPRGSGHAKVGLLACYGPKKPENWATFRHFRMLRPVR